MSLGSLLLVQDVKGRVVDVELAAWNVEQESLRFSKANAGLAAEARVGMRKALKRRWATY